MKSLAAGYQLECVVGQGGLAKNASEAMARQARYQFLRGLAGGQPAKIVTAHHADDLLETIVINLIRGTGWRGLAPMWSEQIVRPLIAQSKAELVEYAIRRGLRWVEDESNYSPRYFRNRVRDFLARATPEQKKALRELSKKQRALRREIETILQAVALQGLSLQELAQLPESVALELVRKTTAGDLTSLQAGQFWRRLPAAKDGDILQLGAGWQVGVYRGYLTFYQVG